MGASSDLGQPFRPREKSGFWLGENRVSRYNNRTEGALPPTIAVIARFKMLGFWICNVSLKRINSKI